MVLIRGFRAIFWRKRYDSIKGENQLFLYRTMGGFVIAQLFPELSPKYLMPYNTGQCFLLSLNTNLDRLSNILSLTEWPFANYQ